jgi:hypothetical protein
MSSSVHEVVVGGKQRQLMPAAELNEKSIDRSELNSRPAAGVAYLGCRDVIVPIGGDDWQSLEAFNDCRRGMWPVEALQQLLKNQPCSDHCIGACKSFLKRTNLWRCR